MRLFKIKRRFYSSLNFEKGVVRLSVSFFLVLNAIFIDPFVTLMDSFNWGSISHNDIVSKFFPVIVMCLLVRFLHMFRQ